MSKKLYRVEVAFSVYVLAESDSDAETEARAAYKHYPDECGEPDSIATLLHGVGSVPPEWLDALPFGADDGDERTVRQVLEAQNVQS